MELNERSLEVLIALHQSDAYLTTSELAQQFKVSDRTIRNDLKEIESHLKSKGFSDCLVKNRAKGIRLESTEAMERYLLELTAHKDLQNYYYSKRERVLLMALKLLEQSDPITLGWFSDFFGVSRNTLLKELDEVEIQFREHDLRLVRKPKIGLYVEGKELKKRKMLLNLIGNTLTSSELFEYVNEKVSTAKPHSYQYEVLFSELDLEFLNGLIRDAEYRLERQFTDIAYGNLLTHIALMIKRLQLKKEIHLPPIEVEGLHLTQEYLVAERLTASIEEKFGIEIPDDERRYITFHLLSAHVITGEMEDDALLDVVQEMLDVLEARYDVDFGPDRLQIAQNLLVHLRPSVYRIRFGLRLINPLFDSIVKNYPDLYEQTKSIASRFAEYVGMPIDDHEVSYITLHFGAALERAKAKSRKPTRVVVVCGTGIGTANMLASQLNQHFQLEIVQMISARQAYMLQPDTYDYVVSTVEIPEWQKSDYLRVRPILLPDEITKLSQYFNAKGTRKKDKEIDQVKRVLETVEKFATIHDRQKLEVELLYTLKRKKQKFDRAAKEKEIMLNDLLDRKTVQLKVDCKDWKDAVQRGAAVLEEKGSITADYVTAIFENFEKMGTYMVVAPGIVLSHARPENGVNEVCMSMITLKEPIEFGSDLNDPVKLVVTFAAVDSQTHLTALSQLMNLFLATEDLERIMDSSNKEEVLAIIEKHSNK